MKAFVVTLIITLIAVGTVAVIEGFIAPEILFLSAMSLVFVSSIGVLIKQTM